MELNDVQLKQLAEFTSNLSLVFAASIIAPFFSGVDTFDLLLVLLGLTASFISLGISLMILRGKEL